MSKVKKIKLNEDMLAGRHKKLSTRELRHNLAEALTFTSKERGKLILTKNGEDRAGLVSIEDVWVLDALDELGIKDAIRSAPNNDERRYVFWTVLRERLLSIAVENKGARKKSHERGSS